MNLLTHLWRALPSVLWFGLVLGGLAFINWGPSAKPPLGPIAARFLPTNTYIVSGDLVLDGFTNRYIITPEGVPQGRTIRPQDVADQPVIPAAPPVRLLLSLPVTRAMVAAGLNAGKMAQLCGKAPEAIGTVTVLSLRCGGGGPGEACTAVIEFPLETAGDLAAKGLKDKAQVKDLRLADKCG